jgi:hypothetical protein
MIEIKIKRFCPATMYIHVKVPLKTAMKAIRGDAYDYEDTVVVSDDFVDGSDAFGWPPAGADEKQVPYEG